MVARLLEAGHTHLTRERRPEGECPACDAEWEAQRARVERERGRHYQEPTGKQPATHSGAPCTATRAQADRRRHAHFCDLHARHHGHHHCPKCGETWSSDGNGR